MNILVDENMPFAERLFSQTGQVFSGPGRSFRRQDLEDRQALMVRSITQVNAELLSGSEVRFVGTATAGTDHVDQAWLAEQGITFASAPGCNAVAVVEYLFSALMCLAERQGFQLRDKTVGIIGVGQVGERLWRRLQALGVNTLLCDPPRARRGDPLPWTSLTQLVAKADILTLHTPLISEGSDRTFHLVDDDLLAALPDDRILINASRGAVVDNAALLNTLQKGKRLATVLDVWEPEPQISLPLMERVAIATPHIAGYSLEGKTRGTTQIFEAFSQWLGTPTTVSLHHLLPAAEFNRLRWLGEWDENQLRRLMHLVYDVRRDDAPLRRVAGIPGAFDHLRKCYQERREWSALTVECDSPSTQALLQHLGFQSVLL